MRRFFPGYLCVVDAGGSGKARGQMIEKKIETLEDMATRVRSLLVRNVTLFDYSRYGR
jgi:hypothetical protein